MTMIDDHGCWPCLLTHARTQPPPPPPPTGLGEPLPLKTFTTASLTLASWSGILYGVIVLSGATKQVRELVAVALDHIPASIWLRLPEDLAVKIKNWITYARADTTGAYSYSYSYCPRPRSPPRPLTRSPARSPAHSHPLCSLIVGRLRPPLPQTQRPAIPHQPTLGRVTK